MQTQKIDTEIIENHLYTIHIIDDSPLVIRPLKQELEKKRLL